jgi:hypothetical protein
MQTARFTRCDSGTMIWKRAWITYPEVKDNGARNNRYDNLTRTRWKAVAPLGEPAHDTGRGG